MNALYRIIAASLMGLIVHASMLATLPVVWCVSGHGHSALEPCILAAHHEHHGASFAAKPSVKEGSAPFADHDHSSDCIDIAAMAVFSSTAETTQCIDLTPIFASVPPLPSLASSTTPRPPAIPSRADERTNALPLVHLRSVVLLI
jgi:hypothetical protein